MTLQMLRHTWLILLAAMAPSVAAAEVSLTEVWTLQEGLDRPESVVYDVERDVLYVSNIGGAPSEKDGNGYLARVSPSGELVEEKWVTGGMHAPKGLALKGNRLYVADIDTLVVVDVAAGEIVARHQVNASGTPFLNDVTIDADGHVYVSDSSTGRIYRLHEAAFQVWLETPEIQSPNGLHVVDGKLIAAAADATAEKAGASRYLRVIDLETRRVEPLAGRTPIGGVDAVEPDEYGGYFLSDWPAGKVMYFPADNGRVQLLKDLGQGTADLEYVAAQRMVYLPIMMSDQLVGYRVNR